MVHDDGAGVRTARFTLRRPGRTAHEVLLQVLCWNLMILGALALLLGGSVALIKSTAAGLGVGLGIVTVVLGAGLGWLWDTYLTHRLSHLRGVLSVGGYVLKLGLLLLVILAVKATASISLEALVIGFVAGTLVSLIVSSAVVMRGRGPDFDPRES